MPLLASPPPIPTSGGSPTEYSLSAPALPGTLDRLQYGGRQVKPIGRMSSGFFLVQPRYEGTTTILTAAEIGDGDDWRRSVAKLAMILQAKEGWDAEHSQPASRVAVANYLDWLPSVSARRLADAEPMLTDEGFIRMEWSREGHDYTAEIGPESLWLCVLSSDDSDADDDSVELDHYDKSALTAFFEVGRIQ